MKKLAPYFTITLALFALLAALTFVSPVTQAQANQGNGGTQDLNPCPARCRRSHRLCVRNAHGNPQRLRRCRMRFRRCLRNCR